MGGISVKIGAMISRAILKGVHALGYDIIRRPKPALPPKISRPDFDRIHYGCGRTYLDGWLNTDIISSGPANYMYVNLIDRHPFPDNYFRFGFSEDFVEHISQADSLLFLVEVYRTLRVGGVLRLTFPGLESVLQKHYPSPEFATFSLGRDEAYTQLGHVHFYSRDSLAVVAKHIGFAISIVEGGQSVHPELNGINTRLGGVSLHAELTKVS